MCLKFEIGCLDENKISLETALHINISFGTVANEDY